MINETTRIDISHVKYSVVQTALERYGITPVKSDQDPEIVWYDGTIPSDFFFSPFLTNKQRINKIPGMDYICYKSSTFQSLNQMRKLYPRLYTFFPLTFLLPSQYAEFQREHIRECNKCRGIATWIVKPRSGSCGNGIKLVQNPFEFADSRIPLIVQNYISPYLVEGYKFDFRFYVCISTLAPYTVFLYNEGIARFCTKKYSAPTRMTLDDKYAHLTNTAVNVTNENQKNFNFTRLASEVIEEIGENDTRAKDLWTKIKKAVTLTLVGIYPAIIQSIINMDTEKKTQARAPKRYSEHIEILRNSSKHDLPLMKRYFHILGIDIMLNEMMDPVVLELNDRPSMHVTFDLEAKLKPLMLYEALFLITTNGNPPNPSNIPKNWEQLLPISNETPLGSTINEILSNFKKNKKQKMPIFLSSYTSRSAPKLPPLKPISQ